MFPQLYIQVSNNYMSQAKQKQFPTIHKMIPNPNCTRYRPSNHVNKHNKPFLRLEPCGGE
ncbi:unnamed protein product [Coffea canephora]|uniref:DH200=94 genomic scaffold, scaffold_2518 n=1 Tax=Coffea canephora TaxID=49390 RepID=A0A068VKI2_COFCA|nr:unnamed protein product [Coffea canephora]